MNNNLEPVTTQGTEIPENIKCKYIAPAITPLNEMNIQNGSSGYVAENSNGGAFTTAS